MRQRKKKLEQCNGETGGEKQEHAGEEKTEKKGLHKKNNIQVSAPLVSLTEGHCFRCTCLMT